LANTPHLNRRGLLALGALFALAPCGYTYQLDQSGHRQSVTEPNGRAVSWTYDGIYRLTNETISGDPGPTPKDGSVGYGLDPVGNRSSETSSIPGIPTIASLLYGVDDRMIPAETYDNNGNTLSTGGKSFTYDSGNHLKSMNGAVTLAYDGDGNRVAKTAAGITTTYLVDDLNPTGYPQVVEELVNGAPQRTYTYGRQRISQNQIVSGTWTVSFYGYDGFGSVRQLTDKTGAVTDAYEYDAWGNTINSAGTTPNNYLYRGEQFDSDLGFYYLRARYFNPVTGRFVTRDSKAGNPRGPATLHKYLYADGDPVNGRDPSGHQDLIEYKHLEPEPLGAEAEVAGEEGAEGLGEGLGEGAGEGAGEGGGGAGGTGGNGLAYGDRFEGEVYRAGSATDGNLTPRPQDTEGLSTAIDPSSGKCQVIDTTQLKQLEAIYDGPNHVSIRPTDMTQMQNWIDSRGSGVTSEFTQELRDAITGVVYN
jgi:RHS repeat-associated protein